MKRLISHVRLLFNIQLVHLFSNTFETARYNMIIHVIVFLVYRYPKILDSIHVFQDCSLQYVSPNDPIDSFPSILHHIAFDGLESHALFLSTFI